MSDVGEIGSQLGPYRLDEVLGRGGMGEVFRAYDTVKGRVVALKLLRPSVVDDPAFQERFRRESHAAASLAEPHVIPIHDWGEIDGLLYLDMRYVAGVNLRTAIRRFGALEPERAVAIVGQVAAALDAAHRAGLVHRDVKPENILLDDNDFAYLVDFGIVHGGAADTRLTQTGTTVGSVAYMAPELFDSEEASPSTDIYALTCVLFESLTGRVPFPADTVSAAIKAAVLDPPPSPSGADTRVPRAFDAVIARGMARDPEQRYPTARDLTLDARNALRGTASAGEPADQSTSVIANPVVPQRVPPPAGAAYPPPQYPPPPYVQQPYPQTPSDGQRRPTLPILLGVIAAVLIALLALGGYWLVSGRSDNDEASSANPPPTTPTITHTVTPTTAQTPSTTTITEAPPGSSSCGAGVSAGSSVTSCPFAVAVRDEYLRSGPSGVSRVIVAYSPTTGTAYTMTCVPEGGAVACRGGNNAVVYVY
ncbi:serine/threonine-protein kinase [Gordonia sp. CPCC 206044]|uniref:serine/threonine-protein kinase n=1 Tax=Gordonia sp. CPCC 206044 TaxID=3140793 RepID=UPI003AF394B5